VETLVNVVVQGTLTSATLALVALGFSLVFGVGGTINLAHGSFFMIGAYTAVAVSETGAPLLVAAVAGVAAAGLAGVLLDRLVVHPVRDQHVTVLIATLAVAILVESLARLLFGTADRHLPAFASGRLSVLGVGVLQARVVAFAVASVAVAVVVLVLQRTRAGMVVRATAEDAEAAQLMSVRTDRVSLSVLALGASLAGLAGVVVAPFQVVHPGMWLGPLTQAFAIVILGGLGSVGGTLLAAVVVGFLDRAVAFGLPDGETKVGLVTIGVILLTLVIRPQGLRGKAVAR
jgi:branched-chain amino acid transport system permease protein